MTTPTDDQTMAAFDEAARTVSAAPSVRVERTPVTNRVIQKWLLGGKFKYGPVNRPSEDDKHGRMGGSVDWTSCRHLPTPQLCFGLAALPGHLMCADCFLAAAAESPNSCDWCDKFVETDLYPAIYPVGPAIVLMLLCHEHVVGEDPHYWRKHVRNTLLSHN
ncbi:hypothetical protein [Pseudonocardia alaniniphila]|uniref:Uncharacterized protein n=1 Tax=Pseudonocardia alaniniphila TaxID=75291 RepID=A0ABS9T9V2_9PSEU|nr:hypothetical protein [Pseudonocardia alaniniphila]MCH6165318.1 hypothetical protein [Pseudonocardia alaniniphila]